MRVFLLLFSLSLLALLPARAQEARTVSDTVPLAAGGSVTIDNHEGSITVTTWDRDEVRYEARIEAERGASHPERTTVVVDRSDRHLDLRTEYEKSGGGFFGWNNQNIMPVHYTVTMPRTARLVIDDHESDIEVTGLGAELDIDTHEGPITVADQQGALRIDAHESAIAVTGQQGGLVIDTHESRMRLRDVAGRVEIDTHDGEVTAENLSGSFEMNTHDGRADLTFAALEDVRIDSHDGTFTLTLPPAAGFDLDTDFNSDADLEASFDLSALRLGDDDANYRGAVNGGGPRIRLSSHDGRFRLRER